MIDSYDQELESVNEGLILELDLYFLLWKRTSPEFEVYQLTRAKYKCFFLDIKC
jgi:hypothetical protein